MITIHNKSNYIPHIIFIYIFMCMRLILTNGGIGQDYNQHLDYLALLMHGKPLPPQIPDPFGLYYLAYFSTNIFGPVFGVPMLSLVACIGIAGCLILINNVIKRYMDGNMQHLCLLYLSTLPVFVTTSVVFASDSFVMIPFFVFCYLAYLFIKDIQSDQVLIRAIAIGIVQILGIFFKFTFISLVPPSILLSIFYILKSSTFSAPITRRLFVVLSICIVPSLFNIYFFTNSIQMGSLGLGVDTKGTMELRSFIPYSRDTAILSAPALGDPIVKNGQQIKVNLQGEEDPKGEMGFQLLVENRYSYPALVHLAIHTDVRNLALGEMTPSTQRTRANHIFQIMAVNCALILSVFVIATNLRFLFVAGLGAMSWVRSKFATCDENLLLFITFWFPALCWYCTIVLSLPFVHHPMYRWGYWTPRLILPAIIVFGLIMFKHGNSLDHKTKTAFRVLVLLQVFFSLNLLIR